MYERQIATAQRLLDKYGSPAVMKQFDYALSDDPSNTWEGSGQAPADVPCIAVVIDVPDVGTTAPGMTAFIPVYDPDGQPLITPPAKGMQIEFPNGVIWKIDDVVELAPNVIETIMYTCKVSRP